MARSDGGIKITRDISAINEQLKELNKEFRASSKEIKSLDKALKLDPKNIKVAEQYTKELEAQIQTCTKQLQALAAKQKEYDAQNVDQASAEYRQLENQIASTEAQLSSLEKKTKDLNKTDLSKLNSAFKTIGKTCLSIVGSIFSIGKAYASSADEIQKAIDKFGGTAEEWQLNSNAWDKVTGDSSAYESVLSAVTSNLAQVQKESAKVGKVLEQLGLTFDDLKGKSSTEALEMYVNALRQIGDEATRQNLAVALFGESAGVSVSQMVNTSTAALEEYNAAMEEAGLLTNEQVEAGAALQDTFDYLKQTLLKLVADLGSSFKPMVEGLVNLLRGLTPILAAIGKGLSAIGPGGAVAIAVFGSLISILPTLVTMMAALKMTTGQMATAIIALSTLALASAVSVGAIVGGLSTSSSGSSSGSVELKPVDYSTLEAEASQTESNNINAQGSSQTSGNTIVNNYYDNSTMNNNIDSSVDYEEMIEYINDKKRVQIGG